MKEHYETGDNTSLLGYETAVFFEGDCELEFTAKFDDDAETYEDETVCVIGNNDTIDISGLFTETQIDDFYRKAMSVRGSKWKR